MIRALIFIIKYKILKAPTNLSYRSKEFFRLSKITQRKVLDKYFDYIENSFSIEDYFDTKESRFYDGDLEVTFFNCYYFDKLCLEHNINNIKLIDKFKLSDEKINFLINYALEIIEEDKLIVKSCDLVNYLDNIPTRLGRNTKFMKYLIDEDYSNVKYLVNNELCPNRIRELISSAIKKACEDEYNIDRFLKQDKSLPEILSNNFDFILYLISNDIENIKYLNSGFMDNLTISNKDNLIDTIILSLKDNDNCIEFIEENTDLAVILNRNENFINYIDNQDDYFIKDEEIYRYEKGGLIILEFIAKTKQTIYGNVDVDLNRLHLFNKKIESEFFVSLPDVGRNSLKENEIVISKDLGFEIKDKIVLTYNELELEFLVVGLVENEENKLYLTNKNIEYIYDTCNSY